MPSILSLSLFLAPVLSLPWLPGDDGQETGVGPSVRYGIDLSDLADDLFHVTVEPLGLGPEERFFDFVACAPGVHSPLHFGRFVRSFEAFDVEGQPVPSQRSDGDRWELSAPERVARIEYAIEDTFDSDAEGTRPQPSTGTGIESDHVLLNTFGVLGYFEGRLARPVELRIAHPPEWVVGTALRQDEDGAYRAPSYRALVDSPLLMGALSSAAIWVGDIEVEIFVHSPLEQLDAEEVLFVAGEVLEAAGAYLGFAPVERYVILMDFFDMESMRRNRFHSFGALEHNESSLYALPAGGGNLQDLAGTVAHEFMHVLTPLHLRSEVIANFDYSIPTTDDHLWLYEGVTEWSAGILRLRGGVITLQEYLDEVWGKIVATRGYDSSYSLVRLSREWSTEEGLRQYGNIYQLGALTALLLDLRILELSGGKRGLREVFLDLIERYGRARPFDAETFFADVVKASSPEVGEFLEAHVRRNTPLPLAESFAGIGVLYDPGTGLRVDDECGPDRLALREAWLRNLPLGR